MMSDQTTLDSLLDEIKKLNRLTSLSLTGGLNASERIVFLDQAGFSQKEIAETFDISTNLVKSTLYNDRQKKKAKKK